ncbi:hypothetical protein VP01_5951g1 [Puccinia sorghi]|uniref:Uncharacterized protein n=1 Tax=Puccinia sorghi TaxID=27349 RepID=A0A0L6UHM8_9BASI|nr:hypothetical protein VP01_5951g1 [Puccinia sorghi]
MSLPSNQISTSSVPHAPMPSDQDHQLSGPPASAISNWAKIVAASVELMADDLYKPTPTKAIEFGDQLALGVLIVKHLDSLKNLSFTFEINDNNPAPNQEVIKGAHSPPTPHVQEQQLL